MEAASKSGHPSKRPWLTQDFLDAHFPDIASHRGRMSMVLALEALGSLKDHAEGLEWLFDQRRLRGAKDRRTGWRPGIMTELGRMLEERWSEAEVLDVARQLCAAEPATKEAIRQLRAFRAGEEADQAGDWVQLSDELLSALKRYALRHPAITIDDLVNATDHLAEQVRSIAYAPETL